MVKLSVSQRRLIAVHVQYGEKKFAWLLRQGFSKFQIIRWRDVPFTAPDAEFADKACGRPVSKLPESDERKLMRFLEKDEIGIVQKAAKKFDIAPTTVRRIGNKLGRTVSCHYQVHISEIHATKRVAHADKQLGQDHFRKCWADHTKLTVPPEPNRH